MKSRRSSDGQFRSIGIRRAQNQGLSGVRGEERPLPDSVGEGSGSTLAVPATAQHTAAEKQPSEQPRFNSSTKGPPKAPHAVAMEEFVALERKLVARAAPATTTPVIAADGTVRKKRKSAEEVAMEEFMALERKIGLAGADASKRTEQGGSSKAVYSSMERPKVSLACVPIVKSRALMDCIDLLGVLGGINIRKKVGRLVNKGSMEVHIPGGVLGAQRQPTNPRPLVCGWCMPPCTASHCCKVILRHSSGGDAAVRMHPATPIDRCPILFVVG